MKKLLLILAVISLFGATKASAQDYNWAVGIRGGVTVSGITVKHNFDPANSIEGMVDFTRGVNVYALYERNIPVISEGFNFYYGGGANIGSWAKHSYNKFTMGINAIVGLEYKIRSLPLAFSVDYKPCLNFIGYTGFRAADFGLSAKFTF